MDAGVTEGSERRVTSDDVERLKDKNERRLRITTEIGEKAVQLGLPANELEEMVDSCAEAEIALKEGRTRSVKEVLAANSTRIARTIRQGEKELSEGGGVLLDDIIARAPNHADGTVLVNPVTSEVIRTPEEAKADRIGSVERAQAEFREGIEPKTFDEVMDEARQQEGAPRPFIDYQPDVNE